MSQKIYCISGLGADEQVFSKLQLPGTELIFLKWLIPHKEELISSYAKRMFEQVKDESPVMIGVSFGGIICIEIANLFPVQKLFLISTIKTKYERPLWMEGMVRLQLNQLINPNFSIVFYPIEDFFLGANKKEEKKLTASFRKNTDSFYLKWSIAQIVNWKNVTIPPNITHIHGTKDRIFPCRKVQADHLIHQGSHFMIYSKADEISSIINHELDRT